MDEKRFKFPEIVETHSSPAQLKRELHPAILDQDCSPYNVLLQGNYMTLRLEKKLKT